MAETIVQMYPVTGIQVRVGTEHNIVVLHMPYMTGIGTAQKQEHRDRAYYLLPEQAAILRDSLTTALMQIGAS